MTNSLSQKGINKKGVPLLKAGHVLRVKSKTRTNLFRIFLSFMIITYFVSGEPVQAIGTINASAIVIEDAIADRPLSFTNKVPHPAKKDPCLSLLHAARLSPGANDTRSNSRHYQSPDVSDKQAASVALGLFLGVRVALGPKETVKANQRVQIGPEVRSTLSGNDNYALAVASYRSCKNDHALGNRRK